MKVFGEEKGMALMLVLLVLLVVLATAAAVNKSMATQVQVDEAFPDSQGALTHAEDAINIVRAYLHKGTYTIDDPPVSPSLAFPLQGFNFTTENGTVRVTAEAFNRTDPAKPKCTLRSIYTQGTNQRTILVDIYVTTSMVVQYYIPYTGTPVPGEIYAFVQYVEKNPDIHDVHGNHLSKAVWGYKNHTGAHVDIAKGPGNYFFPDPEDRGTDLKGRAQPTHFDEGDYYNIYETYWIVDNNHADKWRLNSKWAIANNGTSDSTQYLIQHTVHSSRWREVTN